MGATDEDNILRLFEAKDGSRGTLLLDLNDALNIEPKEEDGQNLYPECDLEAAAQIGDRIFWIGSHGANRKGKQRAERQVLFATRLAGSGKDTLIEISGTPWHGLLPALGKEPRLASYALESAAKLPPKSRGALNIESLCVTGTSLFIGFRNPLPHGRALLVELVNPAGILDEGVEAIFGEVCELDLGGLGLRDMAAWKEGFLLLGGDYLDRFDPAAKPSRLFFWKGDDTVPADLGIDFGDLNPEGLMVFPNGRVLISSDDGAQLRDGSVDKDLPPEQRSFRNVWLSAS